MNDPFVKMIEEPQSEEAKNLFNAMRDNQGAVPKWMKVMANNEDIMLPFFGMFKKIMDETPLPSDLKWKLAYKISEINECSYCVSVAKQKLEGFGISENALETLDEGLTERELLAMQYAIETNNNAFKIDPKLIDAVKKEFSDAEMVELVSVVGLFNFINRFNDSLGVLPDLE